MVIIDAILYNKVWDIVEWVGDSLKINFFHLYRREQQLVNNLMKLALLSEMLWKYQLVHIFIDGVHSIKVIFNIK